MHYRDAKCTHAHQLLTWLILARCATRWCCNSPKNWVHISPNIQHGLWVEAVRANVDTEVTHIANILPAIRSDWMTQGVVAYHCISSSKAYLQGIANGEWRKLSQTWLGGIEAMELEIFFHQVVRFRIQDQIPLKFTGDIMQANPNQQGEVLYSSNFNSIFRRG